MTVAFLVFALLTGAGVVDASRPPADRGMSLVVTGALLLGAWAFRRSPDVVGQHAFKLFVLAALALGFDAAERIQGGRTVTGAALGASAVVAGGLAGWSFKRRKATESTRP